MTSRGAKYFKAGKRSMTNAKVSALTHALTLISQAFEQIVHSQNMQYVKTAVRKCFNHPHFRREASAKALR